MIPIGKALAQDLAAHRLASRYSQPSEPIFPTRNGTPLNARNTYRWLGGPMNAAGCGEGNGWHTLRRTAGSRWLHAGVNIAQVSRLLGHSDPASTLRVHVKVMSEDLPNGDALSSAVGARA